MINKDTIDSNCVIQWFSEKLGVDFNFKDDKELLEKATKVDFEPSAEEVGFLIESCEFCQTDEMIQYWKSLNPNIYDVRHLIRHCEFCQNEEMIEYYKSLNPTAIDISRLIIYCKFCQCYIITSAGR